MQWSHQTTMRIQLLCNGVKGGNYGHRIKDAASPREQQGINSFLLMHGVMRASHFIACLLGCETIG